MRKNPRTYHFIITLQVTVNGCTTTGTADGVWEIPPNSPETRFDVFHEIKMYKCVDMAKDINKKFPGKSPVTAEKLKSSAIVLFFSLEPEILP